MALTIKPKDGCRWDLVALGEVMLRLDPGDRRVWTTRAASTSAKAAANTTWRAA